MELLERSLENGGVVAAPGRSFGVVECQRIVGEGGVDQRCGTPTHLLAERHGIVVALVHGRAA